MTWVPSAVLMLVTWVVWTAALAGLGDPVARWMQRGEACDRAWRLRAGSWLALLVVLVTGAAIHLVAPLAGPVGVGLAVAAIAAGIVLFVVAAARRPRPSLVLALWAAVLVAVMAMVVVLAAFWALGVPGNYDTGLYHLGAIDYSREFHTVPGLANLHDRFGFNSAQWPLVAILGATNPWIEPFRLLTGLLMTMLAFEVALRLIGRRRATAGTAVLVLGAALTYGALAQYPARLISSPAQDSAALILVLVSTAYLVDAVVDDRRRAANGSIAIAVAVASATIRPLGWVFAVATFLVVAALMSRRGSWRAAVRALWPVTVLSIVTGVVMAARDVVLSGWVLFPLGLLPVNVPWRVDDPGPTARAITAWARTPFQATETTLADTSWIGGWLTRAPTDWAVAALLLMVAVVLGLAVAPRTRAAFAGAWRTILVAVIPTTVVLLAWFVNAPDPRFAWGYLVSLGVIPIGIVLWRLGWERVAYASATIMVGLLLLLSFARGSAAELSWAARPVPVPTMSQERLADGTVVRVPVGQDQCWDVFPVCAPSYSDRAIRLRGPSVQDGFEPAR